MPRRHTKVVEASWSGWFGDEINFFPMLEFEPHIVQTVVQPIYYEGVLISP